MSQRNGQWSPRISRYVLNILKPHIILTWFQRVIEGVVKEQQEATRVGLKFYQISANKTALQRLCETRDEEYRIAREEYEQGRIISLPLMFLTHIILVEAKFGRAKQETKRKLDISRNKLQDIDDELRQTFQEKEKVWKISLYDIHVAHIFKGPRLPRSHFRRDWPGSWKSKGKIGVKLCN